MINVHLRLIEFIARSLNKEQKETEKFVTVHSVTSNSSVFNAECAHFAKKMQNGAVKLEFLTKNLSKIPESDVSVKSNKNLKYFDVIW